MMYALLILFLFLATMLVLGSLVSTGPQRNARLQRYYEASNLKSRPQPLSQAMTLRESSADQRERLSDVEILLREAKHHERLGQELEARLCRNSVRYLLKHAKAEADSAAQTTGVHDQGVQVTSGTSAKDSVAA